VLWNRRLLSAERRAQSAETRHTTKKGITPYSLDAESQETTLARSTPTAKDIQLRSGSDMTLGAGSVGTPLIGKGAAIQRVGG
jgi:hypothetical protein